MLQIVNVYKEELPALRLIGKRYSDLDRGPLGGFGLKWDEWFGKGYATPLEALNVTPLCDGAHVGCMKYQDGLEYWTGMFFPEGTPAPEGYFYVDIPQGEIGTCWLLGSANNGELYGEHVHNLCIQKLVEEGCIVGTNPWFFERYTIKFITPDEEGRIILDYCIYLEE